MRRGLSLLVVGVTVGLLGAAHGARAATVWIVDDDSIQCPSASFDNIGDAVAAASEGDLIVVCPGTYDQTTIDKRLSLKGFTQDLSSASTCTDEAGHPADSTTSDSIVAGFVVGADHVTIRGFTLEDADQGVLVPGSVSATWLSRNVVQDNTIGFNLNGNHQLADHNCIRDNNRAGSATGTGIYSDQGLTSTDIVNNVFAGNEGAGITLIGDGAGSLDDILVGSNSSFGDGDLISLIGSTNSSLDQNTSSAALGSAIYIQDGNSNLSVTRNKLTFGSDEGIAIDADGGTPNTGLFVDRNTVSSNNTVGIAIRTSSLTDSTFHKNKISLNGTDGLRVEDLNSGNVFDRNNAKGNLRFDPSAHDCYDETTGAGTGGTDNTWTKDKGKTQNVPGLCKGAAVT
jgi:hypothetical protein